MKSARSGLPAVLFAGIALAACSSSPGHTASTTTTTAKASTSTTNAPGTTTTTQPAFPSSGPLTIGGAIATPLTTFQVLAAEAPDGTVFLAAQAPVDPAPSVVYVIDGNGPAAVAEHFGSGIAALAADANNLYVATYSSVTAFGRSSGNQAGQWTLPAVNSANASNDDLVSMTASAGRVFVSISQGNAVSVYTITPGSTAAPALAAQGLSASIGPNGTIYYERSSDHDLMALSTSGTSTQGPALMDAPNGEGGGVQNIDVVAGGEVWVTNPAGQGEDTQWTTYDATTLAQAGQFSGNLSELIANTSGGALVAASPDSQNPCTAQSPGYTSWCVSRINSQGVQSQPLGGNNVVDLLGPDPVEIASQGTSNQIDVFRIS